MRRSFPIPVLVAGVAVALLAAVPALAASPTPAPAVAPAAANTMTIAQVPLFAALGQPAQPQAHGGTIPGPGEQGTCTANCWDGSHVTCYGTSCSEVDSNCSSGQRGYCYGTSTGYLYCPPCQGCTATAICNTGSVSCSGSPGCYAINKCYAYCDGVYHWCPGHGSCPV